MPDHASAVEHATKLGYDVVGLKLDDPGWKEAFLHPKQAQGIVVQLVENRVSEDDGSDVSGDSSWRRPFPPAPEPAAKPKAAKAAPAQSAQPTGDEPVMTIRALLEVVVDVAARAETSNLAVAYVFEHDERFA